MNHGWVTPNPDGSKARCGGPAICPPCSREAGTTKRAAPPYRIWDPVAGTWVQVGEQLTLF